AIKKMAPKGFETKPPEPEEVREETEDNLKKKHFQALEFNLKPREVKKHLDRFIIKQEEAKRVLATAVCDHYNHVKSCSSDERCKSYFKQNVIMLGPTGVGKTHLIRHLADLIGVPFAKGDATKFSETGYVGGDVEDMVRDLVQKAEGDIELAQYGMIYLDEVDKIATPANLLGRDVSGSGVQRGLLKIMEETEIPLRNPQDIQSQIQAMMEFQKKGKISKPVVNTKHILFIVSGAFDGLMPIVEKRKRKSLIGFATPPHVKNPLSPTQTLRQAQTEDFIEFGFESEFIGRLPVRVVCHPLSEEDLFQILISSEDSILKQYVKAFEAYGIAMHVQEKALWEIAKLAAAEGTGARGLFTVSERVFRDLKYELPSSSVKEFTLSPEMVLDPGKTLDDLLRQDRDKKSQEILENIRNFETRFFQANHIRIAFDEPAIRAIQTRVLNEGHDEGNFLEKILSNYSYGLGLIMEKKPREKFILGEEAITNPNGILDRWIKEAYEG
ncbi:MAG: AAA family ATPase, partial [Candidatus Omnitrophica bacterium]|nr:AAA family ATPase [Candidatus Omnitrophota bacterium]